MRKSLPPNLIANRAAIIYANSLPEKSAYERLGYRTFFRRSEAVARLLELAKNANRPLALCFINTINTTSSTITNRMKRTLLFIALQEIIGTVLDEWV